jgi:hypothetical protein
MTAGDGGHYIQKITERYKISDLRIKGKLILSAAYTLFNLPFSIRPFNSSV